MFVSWSPELSRMKLISKRSVSFVSKIFPDFYFALLIKFFYLIFILLFYFQDIAAYIKKEFDKKYNPTWHCIVGRNFGSYVTHETRHFIYFYLGQVAILLFKSG